MQEDLQYDDGIIEVLELPDALRRHPNLILGDMEREDLFDDLIFESLCHAIDEAIEGSCKH
jgi:DNA gyrase/topoisomerase IV subunit B